MKLFATATPAPRAKSIHARAIAFLYAGIITVMLLAQLFTFEELIAHFISVDLPGGRAGAHLMAASIAAVELFALPFLLRMSLSPAFRVMSASCGWLVALGWVYVSIWTVVSAPEASTVGFLGTVIDLVPGWWAVFLSLGFLIMAAWSSWGLLGLSRASVKSGR
jgi:hypothetical protein